VKQVLVDTHALLWFIFDDAHLSARATQVLEDRNVAKVISIVSLWEIVIKVQIKKLSLGMSPGELFSEYITSREIELLGVEIPHLLEYERLPLHHRDPFDRLLISQAITERLPVVTGDENFSGYSVKLIW